MTGACLLFDTAKFRRRLYGAALGIELFDISVLILMLFIIRCCKLRFGSRKAAAGGHQSRGTDLVPEKKDRDSISGEFEGNFVATVPAAEKESVL